jgi:Uncharacterized conserved protein, contains RING Zn-finger
MTSSVFFKFKSQKEPTRVEFDGTGISVFELKREIILRSGLGDGTDFDLVICADENMKEGMYTCRFAASNPAMLTSKQYTMMILPLSPGRLRSLPVACPPKSLEKEMLPVMYQGRCRSMQKTRLDVNRLLNQPSRPNLAPWPS